MQDWNAATNSRWAYQKRNTHLLVVYRQDGMWNMHVIRGGIIIFQHGELHAHTKHKDRAQVLLWALATSVALSQLQSCNSTVPPKFYPTAHLLVHHTHAHRHFNNTNTEQHEGNTGLARLFRNILVTNKCFSEELWHLEKYLNSLTPRNSTCSNQQAYQIWKFLKSDTMQIYCPTSTYIGDYNYTGSIVYTLYFGPSRRSLVCSWPTNCSVTSEDIWDREKYGCWSNRKGSVLKFWVSWNFRCPDFQDTDKSCLDPRGVLISGHGQKLYWPSWCPDLQDTDKSCLDPRGVLISVVSRYVTEHCGSFGSAVVGVLRIDNWELSGFGVKEREH